MTSSDIQHLAVDLRKLFARIDDVPDPLSVRQSKKLRKELELVAEELREHIALLDPVKLPGAMFDPADPRLFGMFAAVALLGQDSASLDSVADSKFYGSGIYAIYYKGDFKLYKPIAGTESPIYVGVATPKASAAKTPEEQGTKLGDRLREHRKNIIKADNLSINDFTCRQLVVATNWEDKAESALIHLFRPIWNKETRIIQGFGKHGDAMKTRPNKRSSWDMLHEGRKWAKGTKGVDVENQKTPQEIKEELNRHFAAYPPIRDLQHVLRELLSQIKIGSV